MIADHFTGDTAHPGMGWAYPQPLTQALHRCSLATGNDLHPAELVLEAVAPERYPGVSPSAERSPY